MTGMHLRRDFLKAMGMSAGALMLGGAGVAMGKEDKCGGFFPGEDPIPGNGMPRRLLGNTGESISIFAIGGEARIQQSPADGATAILNRALDLGVNYFDTSAFYGGGTSERNIGQVLESRRNEVFIATKSHNRTYDGTMDLATKSLENLRTDRIDLYQVHDIRTHSHLNTIFGQNGAIRAMEKLRDDGVVRFIGITGHYDTEVLLRGINDYPFDTIMLPLNAADIHHHPFQAELLQTAVSKGMGILAMKVLSKGQLFNPGGITTMEQAMGYVLSFPVSSAVIGISTLEELEENVQVASTLNLPFSPQYLSDLEQLASVSIEDGNWFKKA